MSCHEPLNSGKNVSDRISREREKKFLMTCVLESRLKCSLNTSRHTFISISLVCQIMLLFARKSKHSLKHDSRVRILMRWTLVVSMDRKVFVAIVDREVIGRQVVPNVARVMARDRARKASQAKAKLMMAKEKAKVASGKHAKHLMGTAITVGNGDTWKRTVSSNPRTSVAKAKVKQS